MRRETCQCNEWTSGSKDSLRLNCSVHGWKSGPSHISYSTYYDSVKGEEKLTSIETPAKVIVILGATIVCLALIYWVLLIL